MKFAWQVSAPPPANVKILRPVKVIKPERPRVERLPLYWPVCHGSDTLDVGTGTWTAPCGTTIFVQIWGPGGNPEDTPDFGDPCGGSGGGGYGEVTMPVTAGQTFNYQVGSSLAMSNSWFANPSLYYGNSGTGPAAELGGTGGAGNVYNGGGGGNGAAGGGGGGGGGGAGPLGNGGNGADGLANPPGTGGAGGAGAIVGGGDGSAGGDVPSGLGGMAQFPGGGGGGFAAPGYLGPPANGADGQIIITW